MICDPQRGSTHRLKTSEPEEKLLMPLRRNRLNKRKVFSHISKYTIQSRSDLRVPHPHKNFEETDSLVTSEESKEGL